MIDVESKLLAVIKSSTCFGLAHDDTVPECKMCDVKAQCMKKTAGADIPVPTERTKPERPAKPAAEKPPKPAKPSTETASKPAAEQSASKPKKPAKPATEPVGNQPNFKEMSLDDLKALAAERSVSWKDYGNDNITRMRLIMAIRKSYE